MSYEVQRDVFRCLSSSDAPYYDFIAAETFGVTDDELAGIVRDTSAGVLHIPSWKFPIIDDKIFDLVTATWVLNEISHAGISWLIGASARTLKVGGYLYIRDSGIRKAGCHDVDYDAILLYLGFEEVHRLKVENRVDFLGIPRMYRKNTDTKTPSFDELVDLVLGKLGIGNLTGSLAVRNFSRPVLDAPERQGQR